MLRTVANLPALGVWATMRERSIACSWPFQASKTVRNSHASRFHSKLAFSTSSSKVEMTSQAIHNRKGSQGKVVLMPQRPRRIVVGVTGATGTIYAIRLLELLRDLDVETHLIISKWALATLKYETPLNEAQVRALAYRNYTARDMSAPAASGSFQHDGMIIVPCSMKTLAAVRGGFGDDLIARAADVTLKESRRLALVVRETPLSDIHLDNMLFLRRAGAIIFPPVPAFYTRPETVEEIVDQSVGRMLDLLGFHVAGFERWEGFKKE